MQNSHSAEPAAHLTVEEDAEYRSDSFRMNNMKVLPCSKRFVHDWTECPFAHPQEKARRRDPRVHSYTGIACPSMKKEGCCAFGDHCPYAHNVFEYWLHPTRYRTQLCNDGSNCKRKICFFAHSLDELRVPACKPFVSPEALAAAAASAANDAEAKRKAATVGSPMSAFASASGGPSPQRTSLEAMRSGSGGGGSAPGPQSSGGADTVMGASPGDAALHQALQQLMGAGFSSKDQQVIELVTSLLAQDRVSPEQAASILQQMLPANALNTLQARLNTPRGSMEEARCYSDPLGYRSDSGGLQHQHMRPASFDSLGGGGQSYGDSFGASPHTVSAMPGQGQSPGLEHMAAMHAAQHMGTANMYRGGIGQFQATPTGMQGMDASHRASLESARSSFDTGAQQLLTVSCSSSESEDGIVANNNRPDADAAAAGASQQQRSQQQQAQQQQQSAAQQRSPADGATRKAPAEQGSSSSGRQPAASTEQSHRAALQTILLQRQQMQQLQQQHALARPSEDSSRMSFEHGSMDLGTPRNSLDTTFPPNLNLMSSGSLPGPYFSGTLTTVPEQFPMINAPPPPSSWNSSQQHRFSYDSPAAADRLSQDLGRMSFDAGSAGSGPARVAPQTANPFTSSFFAAGAPTGMTAAERLSGPNPVGERRPLTLPPLPTVRTSSAARSPSLEKEDAAAAHQQLFGGAVLQRLQ